MNELPGPENVGFWGKVRKVVGEGVQDGFKGAISDLVKSGLKYLILFIIVVILALMGYNVYENNTENSTTPPSSQQQVVNPASINPVSSSIGAVSSNGCPYDGQGFQLFYADTWYADPFGYGYAIGYHSDGSFETYNPSTDTDMTYPSIYARDLWIPLNESGFNVCVDSSNYVFAKLVG